MGRVTVAATVENSADLYNVHIGRIPPGEVRGIAIPDALVDTGATALSLPGRMIEELGLLFLRNRQARTSAGVVTVRVFGGARLTVQDRVCTVDVTEVPEDCPVLIGQIPLEALDLVVDPSGRRVTGNPAHGGEHVMELY